MIAKVYDYIFYTFYRFWEKAPSKWWSEWKAIITMCFLWIALITTVSSLQMYLYKTKSLPDYPFIAIFLGVFIYMLHHFLFIYNKRWEKKILKFRNISKKKDRVGITLIIIITILIISSLIFSYNLLSQTDWKK